MRRPVMTQSTRLLLYAVVGLSLTRRSHGQGSNSSVSLSRTQSSPLPVFLAPNILTGSLHFEESYSLSQPGSQSLAEGTSANFTIAANSTLVVSNFFWVSCVSIQLSASDNAVYGFVTNATVTQVTASSGQQDYTFLRDPSRTSEIYYGSAFPTNGTVARLLAMGPNATSASGPVPTNTFLTDYLTLVVVNPTSSSVSVTLEVGLSPLGPCNTCSTQRNSDGLLGNCSNSLSSATVIVNNTMYPAAKQRPSLQPKLTVIRDVDQGTSSVFAVFTNAACMLYTVKDSTVPADLSLNRAQLYAWVAPSAQQQQIVSSGNVTAAQRLNLGCSYPATTNPNRPCYNFSQTLDPNDTYHVWIQNANGGTATYAGNVSVLFELMVLRDTADCSQDRLFNLSGSLQYLNNDTSTPLNYTTTASNITRSPYDPGVTPFDFYPGPYNRDVNFPVVAVSTDGSLSQVGSWNITQQIANVPDVASVTLASANTLTINPLESRFPGTAFANAACFYESLNASQPVNSYLLPRRSLIANYNFSATAANTGLSSEAFDSQVAGSGQYSVQNVNATFTGLSPSETYSFVVQGPASRRTTVMTRTVAYPAGSAHCQRTAAAAAPAPSSAAAQSFATLGSVRGVYDDILPNVKSNGGAGNIVAITGASCIALVISARGLSEINTGPPLNSQYYNISSPGNSTATNMSASAILLQGSTLNQQFILNGFIDPSSSQQSPTPLPITAGCLVNYTSPGPCVAYADNLNSSELYYLWGVNGGQSPAEIWVLISYEARPSGSCKDAYTMPSAAPPGPAPAPAPVRAPFPTAPASPASVSVNMTGPASKKVSVGVIVGPVVGGVAAIAAAVLLVVCLKRRKPKPPKPLPIFAVQSNVFLNSKISLAKETEKYAPYKDAWPQADVEGPVLGLGEEFISSPFKNDSISSPFMDDSIPSPFMDDSTGHKSASLASGPRSESTTGTASAVASADLSRGPAEIVAHVAAAANSQPRPGTSPRTPNSLQSGAGKPPTLVLEHNDQFNLSELQLKIVDGKPVKLGEGGFGSVYLGLLGVREVAVKIAKGVSSARKKNFLHEILILKGCRDPNIVLFLGASVGEEIVLLTEYMPGGDLFRAIRADATKRLSFRNGGATLALDIVKGLYHLHSRHVLHMDLKSPNILLTEDQKHARIADVGLAKFITEDSTNSGDGVSYTWAAPEQILGGRVTPASDMFAFGVILWELCTGESPPRSRNYRPIQTPEECPQAVAELVSRCFSADPANRPTAVDAYQTLCKFVRL